ncbi:uncharacterized protein LOC119558478 [Drosophila subpulchrella]|uniref:uncharacterized protein LOC119558478 n=1 Tax=Drosophila subpulchrella TaxID=1486046 RepID=UPI0018A18C26|nr:uncharacterized protein LOC119558478 [Drosophila subpulchrella]
MNTSLRLSSGLEFFLRRITVRITIPLHYLLRPIPKTDLLQKILQGQACNFVTWEMKGSTRSFLQNELGWSQQTVVGWNNFLRSTKTKLDIASIMAWWMVNGFFEESPERRGTFFWRLWRSVVNKPYFRLSKPTPPMGPPLFPIAGRLIMV